MTLSVLAGIVALLVLLFVLSEILAAVLPLIIVLTCVPEREREALARVLAAVDSSRRLRLGSALRLAVALRRQERRVAREARDPRRNPYAHLNAHFADMPGDAPLNHMHGDAPLNHMHGDAPLNHMHGDAPLDEEPPKHSYERAEPVSPGE